MNLLCDEGVDAQIVARLRADGHSVFYVLEMARGISDETVVQMANEYKALLVTEDKDFGELVFRQRRIHLGVVLLRLMGLSSADKANIVANAFAQHGEEMPHAFTVISPGVMRIRREIN